MSEMYDLIAQMMDEGGGGGEPEWCQAWPYLQRHMRWHGYFSTEAGWTRTGAMTMSQCLDWKASVDGFAMAADQSIHPYQWKKSKNLDRLFTVRSSAKGGHNPSEWVKICWDGLKPEWWIKGYFDPGTKALEALGIVRTQHLVDLIQSGAARELYKEDGTYWAVEWAAVPEPEMLLEIRGGALSTTSPG